MEKENLSKHRAGPNTARTEGKEENKTRRRKRELVFSLVFISSNLETKKNVYPVISAHGNKKIVLKEMQIQAEIYRKV